MSNPRTIKKFKYTLQKFSDHIYYVPGFTNIGVLVLDNKEAYFIDSGAIPEYALPAYDEFKSNFPEHELKAIIVTHAHADHVGGNKCLIEKSNCGVWASKIDGAIMEVPYVMSDGLSGGYRFPETEIPFYMAKDPSTCTRILNMEKPFYLGGSNDFQSDIEIANDSCQIKVTPYSLPGHAFVQYGFLVEELSSNEKIFFAADAIYGRSEVKKYWIPYTYDGLQFIETLQKIPDIGADVYVPSHGDLISKEIVNETIELNLIQFMETEKLILSILETKKTAEQIVKEVSDKNRIRLKIHQNYLIGSTIRGFLSGLIRKGIVKSEIIDNMAYFSKTSNS